MSKIKQDPNNYRTHSERNKELINKSLKRNKAGRSVLIDNDGFLIAGNGVHEQAEELNIPVRIIESDGSELIVVKRTDLSYDDPERKELAIADNAVGDSSTFDYEMIMEDVPDMIEEYDLVFEVEEVEDDGDSQTKKTREDNLGSTDENLYNTDFEKLAGYKTAINRKEKSAPIKYFEKEGLLKGSVIDYGGGMEIHDYNKFDPAYNPDYDLLMNTYDTVICNYVINVIPLEHNRFELIRVLQSLKKEGGSVYLSVYGSDAVGEETAHTFQCGWSLKEWKEWMSNICEFEVLKTNFWCFKII